MVGGLGVLAALAVTLSLPPLTLADRIIPAGRTVVISSLIEGGANSLYNTSGDGSIIDGTDPLLVEAGLTVSRINITSGGSLRLVRSGSESFGDLFGTGGTFADAHVHVQYSSADVAVFARTDITTFATSRIIYGLTAAELAALQGIDDGDRWIFTITQPEILLPVSVEFPALTGGTGSLASPIIQTITPPPLSIELPVLTGGLGSLAAPALTVHTPVPVEIRLAVMLGGSGTLAVPAVDGHRGGRGIARDSGNGGRTRFSCGTCCRARHSAGPSRRTPRHHRRPGLSRCTSDRRHRGYIWGLGNPDHGGWSRGCWPHRF